VDVGVGLIQRDQGAAGFTQREKGAAYNLRNCHMLQAPMRLLEVMNNPHSTRAYETPTVSFQTVLDQATGNYAVKRNV